MTNNYKLQLVAISNYTKLQSIGQQAERDDRQTNSAVPYRIHITIDNPEPALQ